MNYIIVAIGGAIGAISRFTILNMINSDAMPYGTIFVNIVGSFIIGLFAALLLTSDSSIVQNSKLLIMTGILGGFTTFSAFSLDFMKLIQSDNYLLALLYVLLSVMGSLIAVFLGYLAVKTFFA